MQENPTERVAKGAANVALKHVPGLDGLRGLAVLLVVFHHSHYIKFGWIGVQIFFVLSGYLISSILLESRTQSFSFYLKKFYWRRVLRIFPLYYTVLVALAVIYVIAGIPRDFGSQWPYLFSYTFNISRALTDLGGGAFNHFWSLSVEEQFYMVWPFVIFFISPRKMAWVALGLMIAIPILTFFTGRWILSLGGSEQKVAEIVAYLTIFQVGGFAAGAYTALVHRGEAINIIPSWRVTTIFVVVIGLANVWLTRRNGGVMAWQSMGFPRPTVDTTNQQHVWGYVLINIMSATMIHGVIVKDKLLSIFNSRIMVEFGKLSYGIYVYHFLIWRAATSLYDFKPFTIGGVLFFLGYFALVMLITSVSYYAFENKFLKLKDKYFVSPQKAPAR